MHWLCQIFGLMHLTAELLWHISNVSVEEMYKTINRIDGLMFPE
jgi:hypothetical protein